MFVEDGLQPSQTLGNFIFLPYASADRNRQACEIACGQRR